MTSFSQSPLRSRCANTGQLSVAEKSWRATPCRPTRRLLPFLLLAAASLSAGELPPARLVESSLLIRTGFDSDPTAMNSTTAPTPGSEDVIYYAAGLSASVTFSGAVPAKRSLMLGYTGEIDRFDNCPSEDFAAHRLAWNGQISEGTWKFSGEGSTLFVAGSRDTLPSVSSVNANAITLWRERRRQWQNRLKFQAQTNRDKYLVRATGTLLAYDYQTRAVSGNVPFADRYDAQAAVEVGWRQSANSTWLTGVRAGHQDQAIVPLPNCEFDYSNDYQRLVVGWEGKPSSNTTAAFAAGPDFHHYTGAIDSRVFTGGRDRTSLWFEGSFSAKPCSTLTLTGKTARWVWLSSTGKSAYVDTNAEAAAAWTVTPTLTVRFSAKIHRCDYFPAVRDDWESLLGTGATLKFSSRTVLTLDYLHHVGWNGIGNVAGREFQRNVVNLGATITL